MSSFRWQPNEDVKIHLQLEHDVKFGETLLRKGTKFEAMLGAADGSHQEICDEKWILTGAAIIEEGRRQESGGRGALADRILREALEDQSVLRKLLDAASKPQAEHGPVRPEIPADFGRILLEYMVALQGQMARNVVQSIADLRDEVIARLGLLRQPAVPAATVLEVKDWSGVQMNEDARFKHAASGRIFIPAWRSHYWWCGEELEALDQGEKKKCCIPVILPVVEGEFTFDLCVLNAPPDTLSFLRSQDWTLITICPGSDGQTREEKYALEPAPKPPGCGSVFDSDNWPTPWLMIDHELDVHQWVRFKLRSPSVSAADSEWKPPGWRPEIPGPFKKTSRVFGRLMPPAELNDEAPCPHLRFAANHVIALNVLNVNELNERRLGSVWNPGPQVVTDGSAANGIPESKWELIEAEQSEASVKSLVHTRGGVPKETDHLFYKRCAELIRTRGRPYGAHDWEQVAIHFDPRHRIKDARPAYRRGIRSISLGVELLIVCDNADYQTASGLRLELEEHLNAMAPLGIRAWVLVPKAVTGSIQVEATGGGELDSTREREIKLRLSQEVLGGTELPAVRLTPYWKYIRDRFLAGLTTSGVDGTSSVSKVAEGFLNEHLTTATGLSRASLRIQFIPNSPTDVKKQLAKEHHFGVPATTKELNYG